MSQNVSSRLLFIVSVYMKGERIGSIGSTVAGGIALLIGKGKGKKSEE